MLARAWVLALFVSGCSHGPPDAAHPPAPPADPSPPPGLAESVPKTDGGLPILYSSGQGGWSINVAYDQNLEDPIAHWTECLRRVSTYYTANAKGPITGCVSKIPLCSSNAGAPGCCPPACVARFKQLVAHASESDAVKGSFIDGNCVDGFAAQMGQP